jgi:hypothetical protein
MQYITKLASNGKLVGSLSILAIVVLSLYFGLAFRGIDTKTLLDTSFNFSSTHLYDVLGGYSAVQHTHYLAAEIIDFAVMIFVGFVEVLVIVRAFNLWRWGVRLYLLPVVATVLNGLKDVTIVALLLLLPRELYSLANATNALNMAKTIFVDASLSVVLMAAIILLVRRMRK